MAQPYIGEIRMFGGNFAPAGWAFCNGQLLPISEYEALFALIGTIYGGDGESTFALPDLRGRIPVHPGTYQGNTYIIGGPGGTESISLATQQLPSHRHGPMANTGAGSSSSHANNTWAANSNTAVSQFAPGASPTVDMKNTMVAAVGGNQPHDNMPPYLCVSFIIALFGIFPSQA